MTQTAEHIGMGRLLCTRRWMVVACSLFLFWVVGQFDKINISLVIADQTFLNELQLQGRYGELGGLMSAFFIGYGISIVAWGFLVDRFGPKLCLMAGTAGWGVVMYMMSQANSLEELLIARFLLGVAEGNMWPVSNALTNRWFPAGEHSRAQAFWITGSVVGTAVGVPIITALMLSSGWRGMIAALAIFSIIPLLNFAFIANRPTEQKSLSAAELAQIEGHQKKSVAVIKMSFRDLLQSGSFWLVTMCMVIAVTTMYTLIQWTPSFVTSQRGLTRQEMSTWLTIGYLVATAGTILVGYIGDRTMQRARTAAGTCLFLTLMVLPITMLLPPEWSAVGLASLIMVPCGIAALNGALLHSMVRPEAVARGTGIYSGVGSIVSAVGPWAFGKLIGVLDGAYWGGFVFLALVNALGALCYLALHRTAQREKAAGMASVPGMMASEAQGR
jgi:sugar phosphate permease